MNIGTISRRIRKTLFAAPFQFEDRIVAEIDALKTYYGSEGLVAAQELDDEDENDLAAQIIELSLLHLARLRNRYQKPKTKTGPLRAKLASAKLDWWEEEYLLRLSPKDRRDLSYLGKCYHPQVSGDDFVDRFINETAIQLATAYDETCLGKSHFDRNEEHEEILAFLSEKSAGFAEKFDETSYRKQVSIAKAYRKHEDTSQRLRGESLVDLIDKLNKQKKHYEAMGVTYDDDDIMVPLSTGPSVGLNEVREFVRSIAELPTLGPWDRAGQAAKAIAYSRASKSLSGGACAFTVNLPLRVALQADQERRATQSVLQNKIRALLKAEFGEAVNFFFVYERGIGQKPHLHGAVALKPTNQNMKRLRRVFYKLAGVKPKPSNSSLIRLERLRTPGRWGAYAIKHPLVGQLKSGVLNLIGKTRGVARQAKVEWEQMRAEQRDARAAAKLL